MPYSLSFAPEFFCNGEAEAPSDCPTSVYQAILSIEESTWRRLARNVFSTESDLLQPEIVLERVLETDTCSDLCSPVEVWIDPDGRHRVLVYEPDPTEQVD